jgi:hypothetical protein
MKKLLLKFLFITMCHIIASCSPPHQEKDLFGVWKGEFQGYELIFKFESDRTCELSFIEKTSGAAEILTGNFETDFSKDPPPLTIRNIPQLPHPLHTIVFFMKEDSIKLAKFAPRWRLRPISFDNHTNMVLKQAKNND